MANQERIQKGTQCVWAAMGIPENLTRYSTGIENIEDLIANLDQALRGAKLS